MKTSYSSVSCFNECPFLWKLKYKDHLREKFDEKPTNALVEGTAVHEGIETTDIEKAIAGYKANYSIWGEPNEVECYKMRKAIEMGLRDIPRGKYEYKLEVPDEFIGYIDCLVKVDDDTYDLMDFKYSQNVSGYKKSQQIHVYKYYFERLTGKKVRDLYYVFLPKIKTCLDEGKEPDDTLYRKIDEEFEKTPIIFEKVEFNRQQVNFYFARKMLLEKATEYQKRYSTKCKWCCFQKYCSTNGADMSELTEESVKKLENKVEEVSLF